MTNSVLKNIQLALHHSTEPYLKFVNKKLTKLCYDSQFKFFYRRFFKLT